MTPSDITETRNFFYESLSEQICGLFTPSHPENGFIVSRMSYGMLQRLAGNICQKMPENCPAALLCTEEKGILAAAILAALSGGFSLVLPYADSVSAITEARKKMGISVAITDGHQTLPEDIIALIPEAGSSSPAEGLSSIDLNAPFLYLFTGGSTGSPKVWSKTPVNLFAEAFFQSRHFGFTPADRILSTVSPCHIYGLLYSVLIPLVSSASVLPDIYTFPEEIRRALTAESPSVFVSVPVHYRLLNGGNIPGKSLRIALSSAGRLEPADGDYFYQASGVELREIYGSTETGGIADRCRAAGEIDLTPFEIVEWKIDGRQRLGVRSPFISPELEKDETGFFITGDRVEPGGNGRISLTGRVDSIVKVGGRRVDLESLKNTLKGITGVEDAVLIRKPGHSGRENDIYAMIQGRISETALRKAALEHIEPYAIPRRIKIVEQIPISSSGKYRFSAINAFFDEA